MNGELYVGGEEDELDEDENTGEERSAINLGGLWLRNGTGLILFDIPLLWPFKRFTQRAVSSQISSVFFSTLYIVFTAPCSPKPKDK